MENESVLRSKSIRVFKRHITLNFDHYTSLFPKRRRFVFLLLRAARLIKFAVAHVSQACHSSGDEYILEVHFGLFLTYCEGKTEKGSKITVHSSQPNVTGYYLRVLS